MAFTMFCIAFQPIAVKCTTSCFALLGTRDEACWPHHLKGSRMAVMRVRPTDRCVRPMDRSV